MHTAVESTDPPTIRFQPSINEEPQPPGLSQGVSRQQAMWLLPTRLAGLRPAVTWGRWSTVWENIEQHAPHTVRATSTSIGRITEQ